MVVIKEPRIWYLTAWDSEGNHIFTDVVMGTYKSFSHWLERKVHIFLADKPGVQEWEVSVDPKEPLTPIPSFLCIGNHS